MAEFIGTWTLESSDNFDEFLKTFDIPYLVRKAAKKLKPTLQFKQIDQETWNFVLISEFRTVEVQFKENVPFEEGEIGI